MDIATIMTATNAVLQVANAAWQNHGNKPPDCFVFQAPSSPMTEYAAPRGHGNLTGRQVSNPVHTFQMVWHEVQALLPTPNTVGIQCPFFSASSGAAFARRADSSRFASQKCAACEHTPIDKIKKDINRHCNTHGCEHESGPAERRQGSDYIFDMPEYKRWANRKEGPDIAWVKEKPGKATSTLANFMRLKRLKRGSGNMKSPVASIVLNDHEGSEMKKSVEDMDQLGHNSLLHSDITKATRDVILLFDSTRSLFVILVVSAAVTAHVSIFVHPNPHRTQNRSR